MRTVVIFSSTIIQSSKKVFDYCKEKNIDVYLIDVGHPIELNNMSKNLYDLIKNKTQYSIWFYKHSQIKSDENHIQNSILKYLYRELKHSIVWQLIENATFRLGMTFDEAENMVKLHCLKVASNLGFLVPNYNICFETTELINIRLDDYINKPFSDCTSIFSDNHIYKNSTTSLENISSISNFFGPSFYQLKIDKIMDIKIVIVGETLYPVGIIDRTNELDYRISSSSNISYISIEIPLFLRDKISLFLKEVNTNFGVIDFIMDKRGDYYFLEFNPHGIFDDLSQYTNTNIEKNIFNYLAHDK